MWFELGFAISSNKQVVLICSDERKTKFPFDVQHRSIIKYSTESARDFKELQTQITERIQALLKKQETLGQLASSSPIADVEGLSQNEIITLAAIAENSDHPTEGVANHVIRQDAESAGYTRLATTLALSSLLDKQYIESAIEKDYNGFDYTVTKLCSAGMKWLMANQDKLVLKRDPPNPHSSAPPDDDVPF
ncbi:MAG: hypothetical protein IID45_00135 [Planctomycetes bacterium]|nr:hypothetical protein [Planctomycetota bacterium]